MTGQTKAPPPEMHLALSPPPTLPEMTSTRFAGHRLYRDTKSETRLPTRTAPATTLPMATVVALSSGSWRARKRSTNGIVRLLRSGVGNDIDRVGADDIHDHDGRARWKRGRRRDRLILDGPVLKRERHFSGALAIAGDCQIHVSRSTDGAVNGNGSVVLEAQHRPNDRGGSDHRREPGYHGERDRDDEPKPCGESGKPAESEEREPRGERAYT